MDRKINIVTTNTMVIKDIYGRTLYLNVNRNLYDALIHDYLNGSINWVDLKSKLLKWIYKYLSLEEKEIIEVFDLDNGVTWIGW